MVDFEVDPAEYRHWDLVVEPPLAWLRMQVDPQAAVRDGYELKLNSYDLGVDIELADAVQRLRFEHPEVRVVILTSSHPRVFCAGANIHMLSQATHAEKVNFCKFTNETRCAIEDATACSGQVYVAACNGTTAGGGYELALACEEIYLQDDGHAAVSLPEVPRLGVLPGTGGLTRLVDKRRVRRDRADVFCTTAEGFRGEKALAWGLVDAVFPRSRFEASVRARALEIAARHPAPGGASGVRLHPLRPEMSTAFVRYRHVVLSWCPRRRVAELRVRGPRLRDLELLDTKSDALWALQAFRELDHALLHLRTHLPEIGVVTVHTEGDPEVCIAHDVALHERREEPFAREVLLHMGRVLRRMDNTTRSFFALAERGSAFAGCLLELALASDRFYALDDPACPVRVGASPLNGGILPSLGGAPRWSLRADVPEPAGAALGSPAPLLTAAQAHEAGLTTVALDPLDWDDEIRIAIEERTSLSPDALVGLEQNLRFPGPETTHTKIFARLSAWQNWIFSRPNATGPNGALTLYAHPERPAFGWERS